MLNLPESPEFQGTLERHRLLLGPTSVKTAMAVISSCFCLCQRRTTASSNTEAPKSGVLLPRALARGRTHC